MQQRQRKTHKKAKRRKTLTKKGRNSKRKTNDNKFFSFAAFVNVALMLLVNNCLELLSFEIYTVLGSY
jgi:hypothetical protein